MIDSKKLAELDLDKLSMDMMAFPVARGGTVEFFGLTVYEVAALLKELAYLRKGRNRLCYMESLEIQLAEAKRSLAQLKLARETGNENRCETCRFWDLESKKFRLGTPADLPAGAPSLWPGEILHVVDQDTKLCRCMPTPVWKHRTEWCRQHVERIDLPITTNETSES